METSTDSRFIFPASSEATSARQGSGVKRLSMVNEKKGFAKGFWSELREGVWSAEKEGNWDLGECGLLWFEKWEKGLKVGNFGVLVESG